GERLAPGLDDMGGSGEVGLADAEIDDRPPLRLERLGARQNLECRLRPERRHPSRHRHHLELSFPYKVGGILAARSKHANPTKKPSPASGRGSFWRDGTTKPPLARPRSFLVRYFTLEISRCAQP